MNRAIEFPPQYHQAGLGILSYFGTVLRENYPSQDAIVKIQQEGFMVRLIVELENGDREVIEKALQEYELVLRGRDAARGIFQSKTKVLELKNELRIATLRIESQRDIMQLQGEQISSLRQLLGHALTGRTVPRITVCPSITVNTNQSTTIDRGHIFTDIDDDLERIMDHAENEVLKTRLLDLQEALDAAASIEKPEAVANSSGVKKLKALLEDAFDSGSKVSEALSAIEGGLKPLKVLAANIMLSPSGVVSRKSQGLYWAANKLLPSAKLFAP